MGNEFRYNRHKTGMSLILPLGVVWILLLLTVIWFTNNILKIFDSYGYFTPYWAEHRELALGFALGLPVLSIILPVWPVLKIWRHLMDAYGKVEIYGNYAIIEYGKNELKIDKNTTLSFQYLSGWRNHSFPYQKMYTFMQENKKYCFVESIQEALEKTTSKQRRIGPTTRFSLDDAMTAIAPLVTINQPEAEGVIFPIMVGDVPIFFWSTFSSVFDNSDYYVDYDGVFHHKELSHEFISCLVREKINPTHVVADIAFSSSRGKKTELPENILRTLPIIALTELNEEIAL